MSKSGWDQGAMRGMPIHNTWASMLKDVSLSLSLSRSLALHDWCKAATQLNVVNPQELEEHLRSAVAS